MSRRHRILAWVKTDAQRMKDDALAKVTARITTSFSAYMYGTAMRPSFSQRMGLKPYP